MISTIKAFGIEAEDAITIVDKFNEVGNNFAINHLVAVHSNVFAKQSIELLENPKAKRTTT